MKRKPNRAPSVPLVVRLTPADADLLRGLQEEAAERAGCKVTQAAIVRAALEALMEKWG